MYEINEESVYRCTKNIPCENGYFEKGSYVYAAKEEDGTITLYDFEAGCRNGYLYFEEYDEDEFMNTDYLMDKDIFEYLEEEEELSQKTRWYDNTFQKAKKNLSKFDTVDTVVFTISAGLIIAAAMLLVFDARIMFGLCLGFGILALIGTTFCIGLLLLKKNLEKEARNRYIKHMSGLYYARLQSERVKEYA